MVAESFSFKQEFSNLVYLFAHGFWVGDRCTEEAIPLQSAIKSSPVIVAVPSVGQTPRDQGVKLSVSRVTWLP